MTRKERLQRAAPQMAAVYERTFGKPLRDRLAELIETYPDVVHPNWISWEGHRIGNCGLDANPAVHSLHQGEM